ncbi:non-specific lipid-transfer protein-like protein At2g13820 isoform X2 [Helianthus annuus]|uniref:non-specific lipid-transfer protein-like protein At2g13820 isoform X2 n=1 Tax=Helianthus annuus TaxID=4232 RepID=UPI000B9012CE|nr:non-specific lipid-transfer protein-like protein At2g13820 isoform X2 [Helianthus annuus]
MAQHQKTCTILMILVVTMAASAKAQSSGCCTQLASVVRSQPQCLCQVLNGGGSSLGININQTQALELPKACNVQTPPTSQCNAASPTNSPSGTPSGPGRETNTVPSTDNGSSDATSIRFTTIPIVLSVLVAIYTTTF